MPTAELTTVRMWYEERGSGDPFVMLHPGGAGVDARSLAPTMDVFSQRFHVYTPEQRGHGRTPDVEGPFGFELMARDTIAFIAATIGRPVQLLGYSDGASIALFVARTRPDLVRRLILIAGVSDRDGWGEGVLEAEPPDFFRDSYGELSPDGIDHYDIVKAKLEEMHAREPALDRGDLEQVRCRTLVMVADDDEVRLEHAIEMYRSLPDAELAVVPGSSHGLLHEKPDLCHLLISEFLTKDPVPQLAPIRRAGSSRSRAS